MNKNRTYLTAQQPPNNPGVTRREDKPACYLRNNKCDKKTTKPAQTPHNRPVPHNELTANKWNTDNWSITDKKGHRVKYYKSNI